jgi:transcriptional regulator with XRE-family HTH domain
MSIAALVVYSLCELFTMQMTKRKPMTDEERAEKERFQQAFKTHRKQWELASGEKLTQQRLAEIAGIEIQGEPYSQGMVWQYISPKSETRPPVKFVQFVASLLGFSPDYVGKRFAVPGYVVSSAGGPAFSSDPASDAEISRLWQGLSEDRKAMFLAMLRAAAQSDKKP